MMITIIWDASPCTQSTGRALNSRAQSGLLSLNHSYNYCSMCATTRHPGDCHTTLKWPLLDSTRQRTKGGGVRNPVYCKGFIMIHGRELLPSGRTLKSACGDGWLNLCTLIAQCANGLPPHQAQASNQTRPGEGNQSSHHPHTLPQLCH